MYRRGFTLIELMVVIVIIAVLVSAFGVGIGHMVTQAKESKTRVLIIKLDDLIQRESDDLGQYISQASSASSSSVGKEYFARVRQAEMTYSIGRRTADLLVRKDLERERLPQVFSDRPGILSTATFDASKHDPATESSECLHLLFGDKIGGSDARDTDGDGLLEFVDAWGNPLQFYRWPTRINSDASAQRHIFFSQAAQAANYQVDPDDTENLLSDVSGFAANYHDLTAWHQVEVMSAGPDGELGFYHAADAANNGHLGAVSNSSAIFDNLFH